MLLSSFPTLSLVLVVMTIVPVELAVGQTTPTNSCESSMVRVASSDDNTRLEATASTLVGTGSISRNWTDSECRELCCNTTSCVGYSWSFTSPQPGIIGTCTLVGTISIISVPSFGFVNGYGYSLPSALPPALEPSNSPTTLPTSVPTEYDSPSISPTLIPSEAPSCPRGSRGEGCNDIYSTTQSPSFLPTTAPSLLQLEGYCRMPNGITFQYANATSIQHQIPLPGISNESVDEGCQIACSAYTFCVGFAFSNQETCTLLAALGPLISTGDPVVAFVRVDMTDICTSSPTNTPTALPTTTAPTTSIPTQSPTVSYPTFSPTTLSPSVLPTSSSPSDAPTFFPTEHPTTAIPSSQPTSNPTFSPSIQPTNHPSQSPTNLPTRLPTQLPTSNPSQTPTIIPSSSDVCIIVSVGDGVINHIGDVLRPRFAESSGCYTMGSRIYVQDGYSCDISCGNGDAVSFQCPGGTLDDNSFAELLRCRNQPELEYALMNTTDCDDIAFLCNETGIGGEHVQQLCPQTCDVCGAVPWRTLADGEIVTPKEACPQLDASTSDDGLSLFHEVLIYLAIAVLFVFIGAFIYGSRRSRKDSKDLEMEAFDEPIEGSKIVPKNNLSDPDTYRLPVSERQLVKPTTSSLAHMSVSRFSDGDFAALPQKATGPEELPNPASDYAPLNRYRNILPNPRTRVQLPKLGNIHTSTYINANFISDAYNNPNGYIATQGPKPETGFDFWRLIWDQKVSSIVMITGLVEAGRIKCHRYWPEGNGDPGQQNHHVEKSNLKGVHDAFNIQTIQVTSYQEYIETKLRVTRTSTGQTREVKHYWYIAWPDHGVPVSTDGAVQMLTSVQKHTEAMQSAEPWVVHCSAGVGRTGTFIGIDIGLRKLNQYGRTDVLELVNNMRECRGQMVQTPYQARFMYTVLNDYAKTKNRERAKSQIGAGLPPMSAAASIVSSTLSDAIVKSDIGKRVTHPRYGQAILRFVGPRVDTYEEIVGVEFDRPQFGIKGGDGCLNGHRYFSCSPGLGLFFPANKVILTPVDEYPDSERDSQASLKDLMDASYAEAEPIVDLDLVIRNPLWLHEPQPRSVTEALLLEGDLMPGSFIVKRRNEPNTFELAVVSSVQKISHHKIVRSTNSHMLSVSITNTLMAEIDDCDNINELIWHLAAPHPKWPVVLTEYVPRGRQPGDESQYTIPYVRSKIKASKSKARRRSSSAKSKKTPRPMENVDQAFPIWHGLNREQTETLLKFGGVQEGRWLLREMPGDENYSIALIHQGVPSHHLIEYDIEGNLILNGSLNIGPCSLQKLVETLKLAPATFNWPTKLETELCLRPWAIGDLISAQYSQNGKYYDAIVVDIFVAGSFENIPVDMARVSYSGTASADDDCVPLPSLRPPNGHENPDFYTQGSLVVAYALSSVKVNEASIADRNTALQELHKKAIEHPRAVELESKSKSFGVGLVGGEQGVFISDVSGVAEASRRINAGMRLLAIDDNDVSAASVDFCKRLLDTSTKVTLKVKVDPKGYNGLVQEVEKSRSKLSALSDYGLINVRFDKPGKLGISFLAHEAGLLVDSINPAGLASKSNQIRPGMILTNVDGTSVANQSKRDIILRITTARQSSGIVTLSFTEGIEISSTLASKQKIKKTTKQRSNETSLTNPSYVVDDSISDPSATSEGKKDHKKGGKSKAHAKMQKITINKNGAKSIGLRFSHVPDKGLVITGVSQDGRAAATGEFKPGMRIVAVNETSTVEMTKPDCVQLIKSAGDTIVIGVLPE